MELWAALLSPHLTATVTAQVLPHLQPLTDGLQEAGSEAADHHHDGDRPECEVLVFAGEGWVGETGAATSLDTDVGWRHLNMTSAGNESVSDEITFH